MNNSISESGVNNLNCKLGRFTSETNAISNKTFSFNECDNNLNEVCVNIAGVLSDARNVCWHILGHDEEGSLW